ncbi:hypothetical protein OESDEN_19826 [Oesophagostomum dentatum]|uniref:Uncharacterized protein n=1 Tax=Oesophagostomum dentatum TaxID=61180 RepID=A0A0B1S567_OESDE|nr:hypothetical protein OESDEN_19826 [Oesophagostomum dentatum]
MCVPRPGNYETGPCAAVRCAGGECIEYDDTFGCFNTRYKYKKAIAQKGSGANEPKMAKNDLMTHRVLEAVAKTKSSSVVPHANPPAVQLCHVWTSANHQLANALLVSYATKENVSREANAKEKIAETPLINNKNSTRDKSVYSVSFVIKYEKDKMF